MVNEQFDLLQQKAKYIMDGINDLSRLLCDEDNGAPYLRRLADDMQNFYVDLICAWNHLEDSSSAACPHVQS